MQLPYLARIAAFVLPAVLASCGSDVPKSSTASSGAGGSGASGGAGGEGGGKLPDASLACAELGLASIPFAEATASKALYARAADLTIPTTTGEFSLAARWSGCDSYLFLQDEPKQAEGWPIGLWERDVDRLLAALPRNVHVFFVPTSTDAAERASALDALSAQVEKAFSKLPPEDVAWWTERLHQVPLAARDLPSWLGELMQSPGWGVGIDRAQRVRFVGSYADSKRFDSAKGWFAPNLSMAANEALHYNFEAERQARLDAAAVTIVPVFGGEVVSDPDWAGKTSYVDVSLPDAATMASFDTLELDLALGCGGEGEFGVCPAWDYLVWMTLCEKDDPSVCPTELGRWISTYHREGRWVHDVSPLLPLLGDGGTRRFGFYSQQPYTVKLDLRLSSQAKALRPSETVPLWTGSVNFDEAYNDAFSTIAVAVPADAKKVELATVVTGHGMSMPGNCAEFCDTTHTFFVNGAPHTRSFPQAGKADDCMHQVKSGTVPNQYGTWWYGRSGWCPGKEVEVVTLDVTDDVVLGELNEIAYEGYYLGQPYAGDSWRNILLSAWLVVSR